MHRPYAWFVAPARWPRRYVYDGRCLPCTGGPTSAAAEASRVDEAWAAACSAPAPGSLRPRVGRGDTFTMGDASLERVGPPRPRPSHSGLILLRPTDASPLRLVRCARALTKATRSRWAMHIHSPRQYVHDGRCLP